MSFENKLLVHGCFLAWTLTLECVWARDFGTLMGFLVNGWVNQIYCVFNRYSYGTYLSFSMRDWLVREVDSGNYEGLAWEGGDRSSGRITVPWKHGSTHDFETDHDGQIFKAWAKHTGKWKEGMGNYWKKSLRGKVGIFQSILENLPASEALVFAASPDPLKRT